jgi:hypothetical protein
LKKIEARCIILGDLENRILLVDDAEMLATKALEVSF